MTVNANPPCRFTLGLTHGCKTFEFTNIALSCKTFEFTNIALSGRLTIVFSRALYLPFSNVLLKARTVYMMANYETIMKARQVQV